MYFSIVLTILFVISTNCKIIRIRTGLIEGTEGTTRDGRVFNAYYGIPYAAPPIGKLRWRRPQDPASWEGIRKASDMPPMCVQSGPVKLFKGMMGQEDCLYLNVFVPVVNSSSIGKLPVIMYVHGGAFQYGTGTRFGANYLLDRDLILVTINYRLGALGFLSTGDHYLSGNYGLKDQAFALKWIKNNINTFGGNPDNVTLMGESAGAASVSLHFFSPLSKGLFHRAIFESGSAFSNWAYYDSPHGKAAGSTFVVLNGCFFTDAHVVLDCMRRVPANVIVQKESLLTVWNGEPDILFKPSIDKYDRQPFLPSAPSTRSLVSKVPMLTGVNSGEGAFKVVRYVAGDGENVRFVNKHYKTMLPYILQYYFTADADKMDETTEKIKQFYFGKKNIGRDTDLQFVNMVTDALFSLALRKNILSTAPNIQTQYVYLYGYRGTYSNQNFANYSKDLGVCHGDEVPLIFYNSRVDPILTSTDIKVSRKLVNYWANFAIFGNPNGEGQQLWKPVVTDAIEYLHINSTVDKMDSKLWNERIQFWNSLPLGR